MRAMSLPTFPVEKEEAKRLIREAAWVQQDGCEHCDHKCGERREMIHVMTGFGCDISVGYALSMIDEADEVVWCWSMFEHNLAAVREQGTAFLQVRAPEDIRAKWREAAGG